MLMMEENINAAELIFSKWDAEKNASAKIKLLFSDDREEAHQFLRAVTELQNAMVFFVNDELGGASVSRSHPLVRAQNLMQTAMRRLEREFYKILSANHDQLYPESITTISSVSSISTVSEGGDDPNEEIRAAGEFISEMERASALAVADLRAIAGAMISAGYGKECVKIYKILRKSIVDEGLYRLGFEKLTVNQVQKLDRETLDLKIRTWISAAKVAVKTLFAGERVLCDQVFGGSESISESCFADVARDAAVQFLGFAELVAKSKRSPDKLFRILDLYSTISELWPDLESIFSFGSTSAVPSQAQASLQKLRQAARSTVADFEAGIRKDASKSPPPPAGIHPLTRYATNYISSLTDHEATIGEIFADEPLPGKSPSPATTPPIKWLLLRLLLVLLSKLDSKAGMYRDEAISYLFLANNMWFIVRKAKEGKLGLLLGEEWEALHIEQARQYARDYEKLAWRKPAEAMTNTSAATAPETMLAFTATFEETLRTQREYEIEDESFRQEVKAAIAGMLLPGYRVLYRHCSETLSDSGASVIKFAPDDLISRLSDLFEVVNRSG
ncbi:putative exocyst complex component Exo70, cullin repeat-like-containing domain superfamily [Dioscorea sansibarensis]